LAEQGNDLDIDIALAPDGNRLPQVERIDASVEIPGGPPLEVSVRRDDESPETFRARLALPGPERPVDAALRLEEAGPRAPARPPAAHPDARPAAPAALRTPRRRVVQLRTERTAAARDGGCGTRHLRCGRAHDGRSHRCQRRPRRSVAVRRGARLHRLSRG